VDLAAPAIAEPRIRRVERVRGLPRSLVVGIVLAATLVLIALLGPRIVPNSPTALNLKEALRPPSAEHLFGTDNFGRDVLARIVHGAIIDLEFGLFSVVPTFIAGVLLGLWAGTHRRFDTFLMRLLDLVVAFPFLVMIIAIVAFLGPGPINFYIAVFFFGWASYSRMVRNQVLVVSRLNYVAAVNVLGLTPVRVLLRHIMPNVIVQPVLMATTNFIAFVLIGSALGYLGLGVQPPTPEWGVMIAGGKDFLAQAPWISIFPGLAILLVSTTFILLGDGLSDVLRPEVAHR
jgi:peptide/nickel transport system permease protein